MKPVILFDLDGTLLYTDELIRKTFIHLFHHYKPGYTLSDEELLSFLGPSLKESFARYFPGDMYPELLEAYHDYNHSHHQEYVYIYPTVVDTLTTLKNKGYKMAIITTKMKVAANIGLDIFDLQQYFDVVIGGDDVEATKPDPEGILKAMTLLGAKEGIYIGDNVIDIQAGKNAGVKTIGVKWSPKGYHQLEALHPDLMIDKMSDILKFIEEEEKC